MEREISPPPTKRRRLLNKTDDTANSPKPLEGYRTVRVFSWNVNGIQAFIPESTAPITSFFKPVDGNKTRSQPQSLPHNSLRAFLRRHEWPEVLFLQELKIGRSDTKSLTSLLSSLNSSLGANDALALDRTYELRTVLPRDKYNAKGFQGRLYGVGTILRKDFAREYECRVRDVDWDLEGRVSIVETTLKRGPEGGPERLGKETGDSHNTSLNTTRKSDLAIVNVYAVNGTSAEYKSPETGQVTGTRHDHKIAFHSRLVAECLSLESRGFSVVIAGDLNVARGQWDGHPNLRTWPTQHCINRADFNAKFFDAEDNKRARAYKEEAQTTLGGEECFNGVDVFRALHGAERKYTYHPRTKVWGSSCDRVDLIIVSKALWEGGRVLRTGILDTPAERGPSDHVPLWVEIAMESPLMKPNDQSSKEADFK